MAISVGTKAPDFTLKTKTVSGKDEITLSDNFGKNHTVLLFFPFAFSSVCTEELCSVRDSLASFSSLDAVVFGISVDSPFAQQVMAEKDSINFPLLSDFNKEVSKAYDVLYEDFLGFKGVAKRSAFVINPEGEIVYATSSDDPKVIPDFDAIRSAIQ